MLLTFQTSPVHAVSSGYERFKDGKSEVKLEYLPIVPYDPSYPTASEEFAIKFHIWQRSWWVVPLLCKRFPRGFEIKVYYRCDSCGYSDYVTWKEWYPTSTSQYGWTIAWSLSGGYGPLTLSTTVEGPSDVFGYDRNYDKYDESYGGKTYLHVGELSTTYRSSYSWGDVDVYGGGSIGIPNAVAQAHEGHHVLIWVHVLLRWLEYDWWGHYPKHQHYDFVLGDDTPADTDCWLTVVQGGTSFSSDDGEDGGGGGGCPTLFVWNGSQYVEEATLNIHADSDITLQHMIGEQTLVPDKNFYKLSLRELDEFTSHIDYTKLYVVDSDGEMHETHLTNAVHSELGDVKEPLLHDDDARLDLTPEQTIDLQFTVPNIDDVAYFIFEINGFNKKTVFDGPM